jgi:hypothetical protein
VAAAAETLGKAAARNLRGEQAEVAQAESEQLNLPKLTERLDQQTPGLAVAAAVEVTAVMVVLE